MRLLLLAGTTEARQLAERLHGMSGLVAVASLAGGTRNPVQLRLPTRMGGFGGRDGFRAYLMRHDIQAVLDATHPFAARISIRTAEVCGALGIPYAQVLRPPWVMGAGEAWTDIAGPECVADHVPDGARVFLATGPNELRRYAGLVRRKVFCRRIDPPRSAFPFAGGEFVVGRPPFTLESEMELFASLGIEWLVTKNSGGQAGRAKLDAARQLGLRVLMLGRPAPPPGALCFAAVDEAADWVRRLL